MIERIEEAFYDKCNANFENEISDCPKLRNLREKQRILTGVILSLAIVVVIAVVIGLWEIMKKNELKNAYTVLIIATTSIGMGCIYIITRVIDGKLGSEEWKLKIQEYEKRKIYSDEKLMEEILDEEKCTMEIAYEYTSKEYERYEHTNWLEKISFTLALIIVIITPLWDVIKEMYSDNILMGWLAYAGVFLFLIIIFFYIYFMLSVVNNSKKNKLKYIKNLVERLYFKSQYERDK